MKSKIHPEYVECQVTCGCGSSFVTRATVDKLAVEVCSGCHPFYTGQQRYVDTAGRVEKFQKKYSWDARQAVTQAAADRKKKAPVRKPPQAGKAKAKKAAPAAEQKPAPKAEKSAPPNPDKSASA